MIKIINLTKKYKIKTGNFRYSDFYALDNISTIFKENIINGITGSSGSGKTTLANIISGYDRDYSGEVLYDNSQEKKYDYIRYVFQDPYISLNMVKTVEWHIMTASELNNVDIESSIKKFESTRLDYDDYRSKYVNTLSGGEMQKLAFTIAIIPDPKYIVLDEAFSMLDPINLFYMLSLLKSIRKTISVIYIDHDINRVAFASDYIYILNKGRIIEENDTDTIMNKPENEYTKKLIEYSPDYKKRI
ncbi:MULTISPECIES: ABC transporter ATP-binding protein [Acidiplasma]|uniref:ABC transporter domain-containing protein n=2 Tax=Acidiplasma TaxID=507753 RepID=A0A0Q0RXX3_9ARCH|nr:MULTISPECIES: ATP-binding cassette domain-containing protein [Acidiplasma]KJE49200.1 hypothetical protein TZ01_03750 [Acidiplasma sp. MBA-1]KPV46459.1 hypothetical protein SE19_05430 [Acidiplasma aeolicum]KQB34896.1 hypothetical protein AOG55_08710 [Acidiplasma cupricumulans]KQB36634.1 hypothetical protein AOG54_07140 [Acidiplasma aeolicum]WMT54846.1 MAG: ATP-binding cassette domain-containing protein [Acidiplasma sp.]